MNLPEFSQGGERIDIAGHGEYLAAVGAFHARASEIQDYMNNGLPVQREVDVFKEELARLCPYTSRVVTCRGDGMVPKFTDGQYSGGIFHKGLTLTGTHMGPKFLMIGHGEDQKTTFMVGHSIVGNSFRQSSFAPRRTVDDEVDIVMAADSSIILMDELDPIADAYGLHDEQVLVKLREQNAGHSQIVISEEFMSADHQQQERILTSFLNEANSDMKMIGSELTVLASDGYFPFLGEVASRAVIATQFPGVRLYGECLGLVSYEALELEEFPYSRELFEHIPKGVGGLALGIDLEQECMRAAKVDDYGLSILFVPVQGITEVQLER